MKDILARLDERRAKARLGGGQRRIEAQHAKGKLTARERIELLLDHGSFEEFDMFVEHRCTDFGMENEQDPRRRRRHRLGHGQRPHGLSSSPRISPCSAARCPRTHAQKITKIQDMAMKNRAPIIGLFDAGGARIQEGVAALGGYGEVFQRNVLASGVIPQISRHHGALRRRRRLFAGDDRLHLHGARHELHVRHRPRRGEDRDQRDRHGGGARRRAGAHHAIVASPTAPTTTTSRRCCRCAG